MYLRCTIHVSCTPHFRLAQIVSLMSVRVRDTGVHIYYLKLKGAAEGTYYSPRVSPSWENVPVCM